MKPKSVKAWACGKCKKIYGTNVWAKKNAESCCVCFEKGCKNPSTYTGTGTRCRPCHAKDVLKRAEENLGDARVRLDEARKAAVQLGVG